MIEAPVRVESTAVATCTKVWWCPQKLSVHMARKHKEARRPGLRQADVRCEAALIRAFEEDVRAHATKGECSPAVWSRDETDLKQLRGSIRRTPAEGVELRPYFKVVAKACLYTTPISHPLPRYHGDR